MANAADSELFGGAGLLRDAVICFYLMNEGVSILEHAAMIGLPVPQKLQDALARLKGGAATNSDITTEEVMTMDTPVEPLKTRTINKKLCPDGLKNNPNKDMDAIKYVTIHTTANYAPTATAKNHADYTV